MISSVFSNVKISHIMAFDAFLGDFTINGLCEKLLKTTFLKNHTPYFESLNPDIYDLEYIKSNLNSILKLDLEFRLSDLLDNRSITDINYDFSICDDIIKVYIIFDKCGICSVRFDFVVNESINTENLINLSIESCALVDNESKGNDLFSIIKNDLKKTDIQISFLQEPMTYSVVSIQGAPNFNGYPVNYRKEIFGISWRYDDYNHASKTLINEVCSNNIPILSDDILLVTRQSTLMIFSGDPNDSVLREYMEDRIIAIELFWRQKLLLKKLDYQITDLFKYIKQEETKGDIKAIIKKIKDTQITMHSDLETYRNTILSVTNTYLILFRTLNKVFEVDTQFNFVQKKLDACDNIYESLHDEQRNYLMEKLQWIVIILGVVNIICLVVSVAMDYKNLGNLTNIIILIFLVLSLISIGLIMKIKK